MKYLTNIDLTQNELQNAVIQPLATAPSGKLGQIYYNSADKILYQHDGTQWVAIGITYDLQTGSLSSNSIPVQLVGSDGTTDTVTIKGAGGTTLSKSGNEITITTPNGDNTTYTFTGAITSTGYTITITPSSGSVQTVTIGLASATEAGLMSSSDYSKLSGIAYGAEVNQNAFSNVSVSGTTIAADSKTDTLTLAAGSNVTLTGNASNDTVTIAATDTTYSTVTEAELTAGTNTNNRVITPKVMHDYIASVLGDADAMRFKGTIGTGGTVTTLPSSHKRGDTYRVITAGTYAGQTCEIGDLIIALGTSGTTASDWTVAQTNIDGAITSISGTAPISVTGSGSSRTVAHENSGVTAASKGDTSNQTPNFGSTFKALSGTVNATGHLTAFAEHTVKIPDYTASSMSKGLMSVADKRKLDGLYNYATDYITSNGTSCDIDLDTDAALNIGQVISVNAYIKETSGNSTKYTKVEVDWYVQILSSSENDGTWVHASISQPAGVPVYVVVAYTLY